MCSFLNDIVKETNETGTFQIGNLKVTINSLEEQQHKYIRLWYLNFITETIKIKKQLVV